MTYPDEKLFSCEQKEEIAKALKKRNVELPCSRCGNAGHSIESGYALIGLHKEFSYVAFYNPNSTIPCVSLICSQCGLLSSYAVGILLPELFAEKNEQLKKKLEAQKEKEEEEEVINTPKMGIFKQVIEKIKKIYK